MDALSALQFNGSDMPSTTPVTRKITEASQQFEAVLLGQWLQAAEDSFGSVPGAEENSAGGPEIKEFAMQHLAAEIAKSGGIGIARIVQEGLTRSTGAAHQKLEAGDGK